MTHRLIPALATIALLSGASAYAGPQDMEPQDEDPAEEAMADVMDAETEMEEAIAETETETETETDTNPTYIVSATGRFLEAYPTRNWLDPELEICLEEGEVVQLARPASSIASMELRGEMCSTVAAAPDVATVVVETVRPPRNARMGSVRGSGSSAGVARVAGFRIASGSADVLERFPRGSQVTRETEICLERGQQVTLISHRGQRVTYRGPGCARRNAQPSSTNLGGFTFGWNGHATLQESVALP